jgi:class 3 adenylate cyclase
MKRLLIILLCVLPLFVIAQQNKDHIVYINKDSLEGYTDLSADWRFHGGDDSNWKQKDFNDSDWLIVNSALWLGKRKDGLDTFNSTGWFRLHINIDSTITGQPIALQMSHYGASEIYLDGKRIASWGKVADKDSVEYYDPQYTPFIITISNTGLHTIAVRYANYNAQFVNKRYNRNMAGFEIRMGQPKTLIFWREYQILANTFFFILLFGIFITLSFLHLFLYLYYRQTRSNLNFSVFCLSLSLLFYAVFVHQTSHSVQTEFSASFMNLVVAATACSSLSGLINELFSNRKNLRSRLIKVLCLAAFGSVFISIKVGFIIYFILIIIVLLEAIILTIVSIYRKIKGARIIGVGILFFTLFVLSIIVLASLGYGNFNDSKISGKIFELVFAAAILSIPASMSAYLAWKFSTVNKELKTQLVQVQMLSEKALEQEQEKKKILENKKQELEDEVAQRTLEVISQKEKIEKQHEELKAEKKKSDDLLNNILPEEVADELKQRGTSSARFFDHVTVLFTDFVNFTKAGERMSPQELVDELNTCFKAFDEIISKYNIEKIKTIGDAYLAVCGLPVADDLHATHATLAALEIKQFMIDRKQKLGDKTFEVRIGIHSGSVVAGIVGVKKFAYDIWGDTVNTAARMEQNSEPGKINISQTTYELVKDKFNCTYRGEITAKNKGELNMYFVEKEN